LEWLVDPSTRGDPMSPLRWTCKSTHELAQALTGARHSSCPVGQDECRFTGALPHQNCYSC
jgi:hypothetical protein